MQGDDIITVFGSFLSCTSDVSVLRPNQGSINDDLESFFESFPNEIKNSYAIVQVDYRQKVKASSIRSFFLPKLTNEELKLIEEKNQDYLNIFGRFNSFTGKSPDVDLEEMKKSDSKDKYVHCPCLRRTIHFTLDVDERSAKVEEKCCCNIL